MDYRCLGNTLRVSRIAMGCEPLGGTDWGAVDLKRASAAVLAAIDAGINFFDTADVYGLGKSEERLAAALGSRRHDVVIASKVGIRWEPTTGGRARTYRDASPTYVASAVNATLRRLSLDSLPLLYLHWPDPATPIQETFSILAKLRAHGKVQHLAVSNFSAQQIREAHREIQLAAVQVEYNFLNRLAAESVLPTCRELGIPVVAYGPLAQGLLSGKYTALAQFREDDRRRRLPHFQGSQLEVNLKAIEALRAARHDCSGTLAQRAIRWVLNTPGIACAVAGAKTPEQIRENAVAGTAQANHTIGSKTAPDVGQSL